jgi:L-asparaginase
MKILFIQTGGTIDKDYGEGAGVYNFEIKDSAVKAIIEQANSSIEYRIFTILKKDSQDITDEERLEIVKVCKNAPEDHIVITHGTDTMNLTAETLSQHINDKVIVLTGAARPEAFAHSDAAFNVGTAVGALDHADKGVYIAMSGRVLPWDKIHKDPITGVFSEI